MVKKLREICELVGGELFGDGDIEIHGVSGIKEAHEGQITFIANPRYLSEIEKTQASAIIAGEGSFCNGKALIQVKNPYLAWAKVVNEFASKPDKENKGIHPTAIIGDNVRLGNDVSIQAYAFIGDNVQIGDRTVISPLVYIGDNSVIGSDSLIYPLVTIREEITIGNRVIIHSGTVVGSDGFGYAPDKDKLVKIAQIGTVVIEDDVELGANVTVDRANTGKTVIGRGTKVDNLVQIAHNVIIGENCLIVAQVGISGSTEIGNRVTLAGQVGIVGHVTVGDDAQITAKSGISKSIPSGRIKWSGVPAMPQMRDLRIQASTHRLPELIDQINEMEKRIHMLERELDELKNGAKIYQENLSTT
jgi:UDP-3-O-[3-hydroxymyristoyl] glucosamine N-acyltransferase